MNNWFTVKVKYTKQADDGTLKRITEQYLLSATTFTDAEKRIHEELGSIIRGGFEVVSITRTEVHDIFSDDSCDKWFKCKVKYESALEGEKSKMITQTIYVLADSSKGAWESVVENLKTMLVEFTVPSIVESPIVDVFPMSLHWEVSCKQMVEGVSPEQM